MRKLLLAVVMVTVFVLPVAATADNPIPVRVNGENVGTGVLIDDRTYVPVRFVSEALGGKVEWYNNTVHIYEGNELKRPQIVAFNQAVDEHFKSVISQALNILQEKDVVHYSLICRDTRFISRNPTDSSDGAFATSGLRDITIMPRLYNDKERFVPLYMCGVLVHEAIHTTSGRYNNDDGGSEEVAYKHGEMALRQVGAPQWMIDETILTH